MKTTCLLSPGPELEPPKGPISTSSQPNKPQFLPRLPGGKGWQRGEAGRHLEPPQKLALGSQTQSHPSAGLQQKPQTPPVAPHSHSPWDGIPCIPSAGLVKTSRSLPLPLPLPIPRSGGCRGSGGSGGMRAGPLSWVTYFKDVVRFEAKATISNQRGRALCPRPAEALKVTGDNCSLGSLQALSFGGLLTEQASDTADRRGARVCVSGWNTPICCCCCY